MRRTVHVVAVCGSLREDSKTRVALREALEAAEAASARTELLDLREFHLPPFDADASDAGDADSFRESIDEADAVLLGTPNYHGSYSGVLKNALDYVGRDEFAGTTVGLLEVAGGSYPRSALMHLRTVARTLNAWTLPLQVGIPDSHSTVDASGIADPSVAGRVRELGDQLVHYAGVDDYPEVAHSHPTGSVD